MDLSKLKNDVIDYEIKGQDVPFYSESNLVIQKDVRNAKIKAKGNIISYADCENCFLESEEGTVFLLFGSLNNTNIKAAKNIYVKHSLKSDLNAGQDIIIEKSVFMSDLTAGNKVISESKESKIIGGKTIAQNLIISNELGNDKNIETILKVASKTGEIIFGKIYKGVKIKIENTGYIVTNSFSRGRIKLKENKIAILNL